MEKAFPSIFDMTQLPQDIEEQKKKQRNVIKLLSMLQQGVFVCGATVGGLSVNKAHWNSIHLPVISLNVRQACKKSKEKYFFRLPWGNNKKVIVGLCGK